MRQAYKKKRQNTKSTKVTKSTKKEKGKKSQHWCHGCVVCAAVRRIIMGNEGFSGSRTSCFPSDGTAHG